MREHTSIGAALVCCLFSSVVADVVPARAQSQAIASWRVARDWRVGGDADGALSFDYTLALQVLPDGRIVHLDYKTEQLHFLTSAGVRIWCLRA